MNMIEIGKRVAGRGKAKEDFNRLDMRIGEEWGILLLVFRELCLYFRIETGSDLSWFRVSFGCFRGHDIIYGCSIFGYVLCIPPLSAGRRTGQAAAFT